MFAPIDFDRDFDGPVGRPTFDDGEYELREIQRLEGHTDRVWSISWNPRTGIMGIPAVFASCSGDKTVRIWEEDYSGVFKCKAVLEETHTRTVRCCSWSPSGIHLATASFDGTTALWENVGSDFACVATLEGHDNEVKCVTWSHMGSLLSTCGRDKSVWIWEMLPGHEFDCVAVLQGHTQDVKMLQWNTAETMLFSCSYDNTIKLWAETGKDDDWACFQTLAESDSGHTSTVWAISFDPDEPYMVSCSDDLTIKIWSGVSDHRYGPWKHCCTLSGYHDRTIFSVHWSNEGVIASGAADDAICLFVKNNDNEVDGPTYRLLLKKEKAHEMDVNCVQWNTGDKRLLASASDDGTVKIWELVRLSGQKPSSSYS